jgi:hypothetical protein
MSNQQVNRSFPPTAWLAASKTLTLWGILGTVVLALFSTANADPLGVWHTRSSGTTTPLNADAYGNGVFVAVGDQGTILTSATGTSWAKRNSGTTLKLNTVIFAEGNFVAVGEAGVILTSTNGITWKTRTSGTTEYLYDVIYGDGKFVAVSVGGPVTTSPDGTNWTVNSSGPINSYGVAYGNGKFISVGGYYYCDPFFGFCWYYASSALSSDAASWAPSSSGATSLLSDLAFGAGMFVAVGDAGNIVTTSDGSTWTSRTSGTSEFLPNVAFGNGTFVVVGAGGGIFTSTDGAKWTPRSSGTTTALYNIAYGNGTFVAVGDAGKILQSDSVLVSPKLGMTVASGQLQFSWPSAAGTFSLQQTDNLEAPSWAMTPNQVITLVGDQAVVKVDPPADKRFYRLVSGP